MADPRPPCMRFLLDPDVDRTLRRRGAHTRHVTQWLYSEMEAEEATPDPAEWVIPDGALIEHEGDP